MLLALSASLVCDSLQPSSLRVTSRDFFCATQFTSRTLTCDSSGTRVLYRHLPYNLQKQSLTRGMPSDGNNPCAYAEHKSGPTALLWWMAPAPAVLQAHVLYFFSKRQRRIHQWKMMKLSWCYLCRLYVKTGQRIRVFTDFQQLLLNLNSLLQKSSQNLKSLLEQEESIKKGETILADGFFFYLIMYF